MLMTKSHGSQIDEIACSSEAIPEVFWTLFPCVPFLNGSLPATPSSDCCTRTNNLFQKANTTEFRRTLCQCVKIVSSDFIIDSERSKQLPQLCHISSFPIDPKIDCNS